MFGIFVCWRGLLIFSCPSVLVTSSDSLQKFFVSLNAIKVVYIDFQTGLMSVFMFPVLTLLKMLQAAKPLKQHRRYV